MVLKRDWTIFFSDLHGVTKGRKAKGHNVFCKGSNEMTNDKNLT